MPHTHLRASATALAVTAVAALGACASAQAALLTGSATGCQSSPEAQVFLPWGDVANYDLAPGGAFEPGEPGWATSGGAGVIPGNESDFVHGAADADSLALPDGSSATSPTFCVGVQDPTVRLFATNSGSSSSTLSVNVNFVGPLGLPVSAQIGSVSANGSWQPTPVMPIVVNLLTLLPGNETPVSLTMTPHGSGGDWAIDDVYVDPMFRGG